MPDIQDPTIPRKLARRFGIKGEEVAPFLSPEIVPIVVVADLSTPQEEDTDYQRSGWGAEVIGGTVGNQSHVQLFNPAGSGAIIHVEAVLVTIDTAGVIRLVQYDAALTTLSAQIAWRDRRISGAPSAEVRIQDNNGALGSIRGLARLPAAEGALIPLDVTLSPSEGVLVVPSTQNVECMATYFFTERSLLQGE